MPQKLPSKNGVDPSTVWLPQGNWPTVLAFLIDHFKQIDAETWQRRMQQGDVLDAAGLALNPHTPYHAEQHIYYYRHIINEAKIPFEAQIIYQDDYLVVADKPHFLPVIPTGRYVQETLLVRLKQQTGCSTLAPIHRIDRETAGLVLFSKQPETRAHYAALFAQHQVQKQYQALAIMTPQIMQQLSLNVGKTLTYKSRLVKGEPFYIMQEIAGTPNAETHITLEEVINHDNRMIGRFILQPVSGKQHQLRMHMASLGMGILNDPLYPTLQAFKGDDYSHPLQLLAEKIAFVDPILQIERTFKSERQLIF